MPTDPFVSSRIEDKPRQEQNLAPGVRVPPARPWRPRRPGEVVDGQPHGPLLGDPGPNIGYALTLAERIKARFQLAPHEHLADAISVVAELAMRRAAGFGRAPVVHDVEFAIQMLGYAGGAPDEFLVWRAHAIHDAAHDYPRRRALVDAVPHDVLRVRAPELPARLGEVRAALTQ